VNLLGAEHKVGLVAYHPHAGIIRDIRVDLAFDVLNVVGRPGERRVQQCLDVCLFTAFALLARCPHLHSNPFKGLQASAPFNSIQNAIIGATFGQKTLQ
jgi:hypothetical protein